MLYNIDLAQRHTWATSVKTNILFSFGLGASWIFQDIGDISMSLAIFAEGSRAILTQEWLDK